jgi:voltage-gated potassium channel
VGVLIWLVGFLREPTRKHAAALVGLAATVVVVGGIVFAAVDHVSVLTGWYWAVTTATTVGYGDVTPKNGAGRVVAVVVMLTTIPMLGAVFALWSGAAAAARLRRLMHMGRSFPTGRFRLVVGMHPVVPGMLDELVRTGHDVVLVADVDAASVPVEVHHVKGEPTNLHSLRSAHPERAEHALVTGDTDGEVLISAVLLRECSRDLEVTALVHSSSAADALHDLGVRVALSADDLLSHTLAKVLEAPHAGELLIELLDSEEHTLDELAPPPEAAGKPLSAIRADREDLVLGLVQNGAVKLGLGEDPVVTAADRLLVVRPIRR